MAKSAQTMQVLASDAREFTRRSSNGWSAPRHDRRGRPVGPRIQGCPCRTRLAPSGRSSGGGRGPRVRAFFASVAVGGLHHPRTRPLPLDGLAARGVRHRHRGRRQPVAAGRPRAVLAPGPERGLRLPLLPAGPPAQRVLGRMAALHPAARGLPAVARADGVHQPRKPPHLQAGVGAHRLPRHHRQRGARAIPPTPLHHPPRRVVDRSDGQTKGTIWLLDPAKAGLSFFVMLGVAIVGPGRCAGDGRRARGLHRRGRRQHRGVRRLGLAAHRGRERRRWRWRPG